MFKKLVEHKLARLPYKSTSITKEKQNEEGSQAHTNRKIKQSNAMNGINVHLNLNKSLKGGAKSIPFIACNCTSTISLDIIQLLFSKLISEQQAIIIVL